MITVQLGKWSLALVSMDDEPKHALAVTSYPYQDGADVEDMGVDAVVHRFECVMLNDQFDREYQAFHDWTLARFSEPVELYHPDLGTLYGYPGTFSIRRPIPRRADIGFDFTVSGLRPSTQAFLDVERAADASVIEINASVQASVAESMQKAGVPDVAGSDWSLLDKWGSMGTAARAFAVSAQKATGQLLGTISQVQAPVDAISASIDYTSTLSGSMTQALQQCAESFVALGRKLSSQSSTRSDSRSIVATMVSDVLAMRTDLSDSPDSVRSGYDTIATAAVAREAARLVARDEAALSASIAAEAVEVEDAEGRQIAEPQDAYLLTPDELEDMLAMVRSLIQQVLATATAPDALKRMAADLTESVRRVKLEYMTTRTMALHSPTPLHALLKAQGLDYKAAERVAALNGVKNPTFMRGEVLVYAS